MDFSTIVRFNNFMRKNLIHTETFQDMKVRCHQHHHVSPKTGKLLKRILSTSAWDHMLKCDHKDDFDILQNLTTACLKYNGACSSELKNPIQIGCYAYKNILTLRLSAYCLVS